MRRSGHLVAQGPRVSIAEAETHSPSLLPESVLFVYVALPVSVLVIIERIRGPEIPF